MPSGSIIGGPTVMVHGLADATAVLLAARGAPVTLLSAPGAALFAGCAWWREVVRQARAAVPEALATDILDCADAGGAAAAALRLGQRAIVLHAACPVRAAVVAIADAQGAAVLAQAPPALDMAERGAARHLEQWLHALNPEIG